MLVMHVDSLNGRPGNVVGIGQKSGKCWELP